MAIAEEAYEEAVDEMALADNDFRDFLAKEGDPGGSFFDFFVKFRDLLSHHN